MFSYPNYPLSLSLSLFFFLFIFLLCAFLFWYFFLTFFFQCQWEGKMRGKDILIWSSLKKYILTIFIFWFCFSLFFILYSFPPLSRVQALWLQRLWIEDLEQVLCMELLQYLIGYGVGKGLSGFFLYFVFSLVLFSFLFFFTG